MHTPRESVLEQGLVLAEELGLLQVDGHGPDLEDLVDRLVHIRADWPWAEPIDPRHLISADSLTRVAAMGIYNRCLLIAAQANSFTSGLETELRELQQTRFDLGCESEQALASWLHGNITRIAVADAKPIIEVLPLNGEQRQAVRQALSQPLTVITGPPGTGKSQVVTSILVNAAWRGQTVLFASKNNKAVDVVETRANGLGPRPMLLRLGSPALQVRLAEYVTSLLAATSTPSDKQQFDEAQQTLERESRQLDVLDREAESLISQRNDVDMAERAIEALRMDDAGCTLKAIRRMDLPAARKLAQSLQASIDRIDPQRHSFWERCCWIILRRNRHEALLQSAHQFADIGRSLGCPIPAQVPGEDRVAPSTWIAYGQRLRGRLEQAEMAHAYWAKLSELCNRRSLEDIARQAVDVRRRLAEASCRMWSAWLKLQPSRLTDRQRTQLGEYSALIQTIAQANTGGQAVSRQIFAKYFQLFPQIARNLSCWAVTNLSARGRLPFLPGMFDLLVVDEASQCDIASALPLLYRAKRVVVIGDPQQLRHITRVPIARDQQELVRHGLLENRLAWSYATQSLFSLASSLCSGVSIVNLRDHHRSHADIINFSNKEFYDGCLRVATRYDALAGFKEGVPAVRWVDIRGATVRPGSGSAINTLEVEGVIAELHRLLRMGYAGTIGVVSPFAAQATLIEERVRSDSELSSFLASRAFVSRTVHTFQGDERDTMLFSPVIAHGAPESTLGFLRATPHLFNVAVTRARASFTVVGDRQAVRDSGVDYLQRFSVYVDMIRDAYLRAGQAGPGNAESEYPEVDNSDSVSPWERTLYSALRAAGITVTPQYRVEGYRVDLALFCQGRRLAIEVDGEHYHRNWDGELCRRDQIMNQRLNELGWDVQRFWVYQIRDDMNDCIARVKAWVDSPSRVSGPHGI